MPPFLRRVGGTEGKERYEGWKERGCDTRLLLNVWLELCALSSQDTLAPPERPA